MREIDTGIKVTGYAFVISKFPAIVIGDGMHPVDVWGKPVHDGIANGGGGFVEDGANDRIQRLALDQRDQGAPVTLADHGISLPVTKASLAIDNGRAFVDRYLVGDTAAPIIAAIALAPNFLATQEPVQIAA